MDTRQRLSFSFLEFRCSPLELNSIKISQHLTNSTRWNKRGLKQREFTFQMTFSLPWPSLLLKLPSQMTSKCVVKSKKWRTSHRCVMFLPHFDVFCDLHVYYLTDLRRHGILYLFYTVIRFFVVIRPTHIPASCRLIVRGFVLV